ncbi:MAG: hypothetical protein IKL98_05375 [Akkermansia sp.]|nr:hypothetical protein [Akkermansia sp.]
MIKSIRHSFRKIACLFDYAWFLPLVVLLCGFVLILASILESSGYFTSFFRVIYVLLQIILVCIFPGLFVLNCLYFYRKRLVAKLFVHFVSGLICFFTAFINIVVSIDRDLYFDIFTWDTELPENMQLVIPADMPLLNADQQPESLKRLFMQRHTEIEATPVPAPFHTPNLDKLTSEYPQLVHEYMLRYLYAMSTDPSFRDPLATGKSHVYLMHEKAPHTSALLPFGVTWKWLLGEKPDVIGKYTLFEKKLYNGWYLFCLPAPDADLLAEQSAPRNLAACVNRLDAAFEALALEPSMEQLNNMLSPVSDAPFLWLRYGEGLSCALIVKPDNYPPGEFELKVTETSSGKPVCVRFYPKPMENDGIVRYFLCVQSGNPGEYYATTWEIWFTPASGASPSCVRKQDFLLMGESVPFLSL